MIALAEPTIERIQDEFVQMLPELTSRFRCRFRGCGRDQGEECVAEGLATAWALFFSARRRNKDVRVSTLAYYAIRHVEGGRRLAGATSLDALSTTPLARRRIGRAASLSDAEDIVAGFYRVFGDRRWRWAVPEYVAPRLDFAAFEAGCSVRDRRIMKLKAAGWPQTEIAERLGVTPAAVCQRLGSLRERWEATACA